MAHKVLGFVHSVVKGLLRPGDWSVDGTTGNGYDTDVLARAVGPKGRVWGFDVQARALCRSLARLKRSGLQDRVTLIRDSHEHVGAYVDGAVRVAMFNLGYLPGADKQLKTSPGSTVPALQAMASLIQSGGAITVVMYRGHSGGHEEAAAVFEWANNLDPDQWTVARYGFSGRIGAPPEALVVGRRRST